jgi:hypothetical protein
MGSNTSQKGLKRVKKVKIPKKIAVPSEQGKTHKTPIKLTNKQGEIKGKNGEKRAKKSRNFLTCLLTDRRQIDP